MTATADPTTGSLVEVTDVVVETLGIQDRAGSLDATTGLFGAMPELDSLAVLELVAALEDRFGIVVEDEELGGEVFDTLGSLAGFVDGKRG